MLRPLLFSSVLLSLVAGASAATAPIDFDTQIRPILNQNCTACHGGVKAAGDISFVYRDVVTKTGKKSGRRVIVAGNPDASEMIARVSSTDKEYRMPPADHGPALPADKIALLREWIKQGAPWQDHWAFVAPKMPRVPSVKGAAANRVRSPVDAFVAARLEQEKLTASPEASRAALLRRVSFDLTGLPPTPEELAAFTSDRRADAYEKQVDRLLASPHFGERWASLWLDLARYADTKGYEKDAERQVWKYRDWLVGAFNRNLPYNQFVIEQLAGDLLPNATLDQHVATTFNRLTQVNDEGGTDDEEYRVAAVIDRVATTWSVTNAVTMNCVQCHAHPYEPIRHQEFYRFMDFLNDTRDADFNSDYPTLRLADDPQRHEEAWRLQREVDQLQREVVAAGTSLAAQASQWTTLPVIDATATPAAEFKLRDGQLEAIGTIATNARYELTIATPALSMEPITAIRFDALPLDPEKARHTPERGFIVMGIELNLALADGSVTPVAVERFFPDTDNLTNRTTKTLPKPKPAAEPAANAPKIPDEVRDITLEFHFAANPTISGPRWVVAALRTPLQAPPGSTLRVSIRHQRDITSKPAPVRRLRTFASADARWTSLANDPEIARKVARVTEGLDQLAKIPGIDLPVMEAMPASERRETRVFARGNFMDKTGPALAAGVPELFPKLPANEPVNRLTMAKWFFQAGQPLTARVAVNRFWEQLFGVGIVATLEDFGSVGERPSHPELLDWLAVHFERDLRWDMKALLRELVLSATYRQEAKATPELLAKDPQNRLLARGPRQRLSAEMIRDQALTASGLLSRKLGGAPVMPPQPAGVWQTVYNNKDWVESQGEDRHRRALYTFWKRSAAYPGFLSFDMPARDLCTARRTTTNTPLQALVTLNDVVYHEAAGALAERAQRESGEGGGSRSVDAAIGRAFELTISRLPTSAEMKRLRQLYDESLAAANAVTAQSGGSDVGAPAAASAPETPPARDPLSAETRALRSVAAAILNLDAAFVR